MRDRNRRYLAYLLRLWQVREKGQVGWRASTENVHTGEQRGFSGLADLYAFIEGEVSQVGQVQPTRGLGDRGTDIERLS